MKYVVTLLLVVLVASSAWAYWRVPSTGGGGGSSTGLSYIDKSPSDVTVSNTAAETQIYSATIPGGTLSTDQCVLQEILGTTGASGAQAVTFRVYYDVQVLTIAATSPSSTAEALALWVTLCADGGTAAQILRAETRLANTPATQARVAPLTVDSTQAKNLRVTVQWTSAASTSTIVKTYARTYK